MQRLEVTNLLVYQELQTATVPPSPVSVGLFLVNALPSVQTESSAVIYPLC